MSRSKSQLFHLTVAQELNRSHLIHVSPLDYVLHLLNRLLSIFAFDDFKFLQVNVATPFKLLFVVPVPLQVESFVILNECPSVHV